MKEVGQEVGAERGPVTVRPKTRSLAAAAVFTAFVAAATSVFTIYIPATVGYFNVGEIMVYTAALLMGPYVGAFAGGFGSALSDLLLGYWYYSPGTLVIKGSEGFVVGLLSREVFRNMSRQGWRAFVVSVAVVVGALIAFDGGVYLSGDQQVLLGNPNSPFTTVYLSIPVAVWVAIALVAAALVLYAGLRADQETGRMSASVLLGGTVMVTGYFLYETFILQFIAPASAVVGLLPAAEVPFNVAQALVGLIVSVPLVKSVRRIWRGRSPVATLQPSTQG